MHVCMSVCMYIYIYMYVCGYVCVCVYVCTLSRKMKSSYFPKQHEQFCHSDQFTFQYCET
jgi:hypothetical protein